MREFFEYVAMVVVGVALILLIVLGTWLGVHELNKIVAAQYGTVPCTGWGCTDLWFQECMETERYTREECVELVNDRSTGRR